jgi:hypothetical protein
MEHTPAYCMVKDCKLEADYWLDTSEGFAEGLLAEAAPSTFYLCADHMTQVCDEDSTYQHLRIDTGDIFSIEAAKYACDPQCEVCQS